MRHSESIASLAAALVNAQADIRAVEKSAVNPHFKSKYTPLDSIVAMARPALAKHALAIVQSAEQSADGKGLNVETMLVHASGEWLSNAVFIPLAKQDPQGAGASVTYGRRFGLSSLIGITSEEDDDGNTASRAPAERKESRSAAKPANSGPVQSGAGGSRDAVASSVAPTPPDPKKPDEQKVWGGKTLGEHTRDELRAIVAEFQDRKASADLVRACRSVLAARQLEAPKPATDDALVAKMVGAVEREHTRLPFD